MKIRIKRKLNEGKGADIIAKGFYKDMIKDLYVTNKDLIVVVLCGLLVISWML